MINDSTPVRSVHPVADCHTATILHTPVALDFPKVLPLQKLAVGCLLAKLVDIAIIDGFSIISQLVAN